jgi:F5/8 type C domain
MRSLITAALASVGILATASSALSVTHLPPEPASDGKYVTPSGTTAGVLVVQANLNEALRPADVADRADLDTFVRTLVESAPRAPDALLLTEVLGPGSRRIAGRLGEATGGDYRVVVAPGTSPYLPDGGIRESAIVVNRDTLRAVDSGFVRVQGEDQAYALALQRGGGLRLPLLSTLVQGDPTTAAPQVTDFVADTFPVPTGDPLRQVEVIGGDWRSTRCVPQLTAYQPLGCEPQSFWPHITETQAYRDTLFERGNDRTTADRDYLFVRGAVRDAWVDAAYDERVDDLAACHAAYNAGESGQAPVDCREHYYAGSPLRWAVVDRLPRPVSHTIVPQAVQLRYCELGSRIGHVVVRVTNRSNAAVTTTVSADAPEPLTVDPATTPVEVPAGEARHVVVTLTTPDTTPVGEYGVHVDTGRVDRTIPVRVPDGCVEPRAFATSWHVGLEPGFAIDDDPDTFWHSEYDPPHPLPQSITLNLGEEQPVQGITYLPRQDGNLNGTILAYNVYVSTDGMTFTQVASGSWEGDAGLKTATFASTPAKYVRLESTEGRGGSFVSVAEVGVMQP